MSGRKNEEKRHINALGMKAKLIMLIVIPIIVIVICSITISIAAQSLVTEGTYTFEKPAAELYSVPENGEAAHVLALVEQARESGTVRLDMWSNADISEIESDFTDSQKNIIDFMKNSVAGNIGAFFTEYDTDYGEDAKALDILSYSAENADAGYEYNEQEQTYGFNMKLNENPFSSQDKELKDKILAEYSEILNILSGSVSTREVTVSAVSDAVRERIETLEIKRSYFVSGEIEFKGDMAELGKKNISFIFTVSTFFNLEYAGISIAQDEIKINGNGYDNLQIIANVSPNASPEDFKLSFVSSDESILTVDANGMIEAVKESEQPVKVTAELEYLGHSFSDSVTVYVINEVDGINISPRSLKMSVGESFTLTAKLDPANATIQGVIWKSENEEIASVNENGLVTAKTAGETRIIAISEEGHFMTGCNITVS